MDSLAALPYQIDLPPGQRAFLLTPYDLVVTVRERIRIEIGRFSFGFLPRIRYRLAGKDRTRWI